MKLATLLVTLLFGLSPIQTEPLSTSDVAKVVEAQATGWEFVTGFCSCPKLLNSQKSVSVGSWRRTTANDENQIVMMEIYLIDSVKEASDWMKGFENKTLGAHCQVSKYSLAVESFKLDCPINPGDTIKANHSIYVRKGNYLVEVQGSTSESIERFAKYAWDQLPPG